MVSGHCLNRYCTANDTFAPNYNQNRCNPMGNVNPEPDEHTLHVTDQGRFAAADWLESALVNNGVETGGGWPLALVDGIIHLIGSVPSAQRQPGSVSPRT